MEKIKSYHLLLSNRIANLYFDF